MCILYFLIKMLYSPIYQEKLIWIRTITAVLAAIFPLLIGFINKIPGRKTTAGRYED